MKKINKSAFIAAMALVCYAGFAATQVVSFDSPCDLGALVNDLKSGGHGGPGGGYFNIPNPLPASGMKSPGKASAIADTPALAKVRQFLIERENAHIDYMDQVSGDPGHNAVSLLIWSTKDRYAFLRNTLNMLPANHAAAQIISNGLQRANQILQSNGTGWYDGGLDTLLYETVRAAYAALG